MAIPLEGLYVQKALGPGKIPRYNPISNIRTFAAGGAILAGRAVMGDSSDPILCYTYGTVGRKFLGVSCLATDTHEADETIPAYRTGDAVGVMDQGVIMVFAEEAIALGDPVRIRHTADTGKVAGSFCKTADANKTCLVSGAEYRSVTTTSGQSVELYLDAVLSVTADT